MSMFVDNCWQHGRTSIAFASIKIIVDILSNRRIAQEETACQRSWTRTSSETRRFKSASDREKQRILMDKWTSYYPWQRKCLVRRSITLSETVDKQTWRRSVIMMNCEHFSNELVITVRLCRFCSIIFTEDNCCSLCICSRVEHERLKTIHMLPFESRRWEKGRSYLNSGKLELLSNHVSNAHDSQHERQSNCVVELIRMRRHVTRLCANFDETRKEFVCTQQ
jgi:hypothetical protein